jgi:TRAP-type transport system periplasmic protein
VQRNTANGAVMTWQGLTTFKLQEVTSYHLQTSLGATLAMLFMAKSKYDALPPDVRKVIDANAGEAESRRAGVYYDDIQNVARDQVKAAGGNPTIVTLPDAQAASWRQRILPVVEEWKKSTPDGDKILAKFQELLADVKAGK